MSRRAPIRRRRDGRFTVELPGAFRQAFRDLAGELVELVTNEDPTSDAAMARLFPAAYPDDPLQELEYEHAAHDGLLAGRIDAVRTVERTADARDLSEDELLAWMAVANDLRLVMGTRLEVTEESGEEDFTGGDRDTYELYLMLSGVVELIVQALGEPAAGR